MQAQKEHLKRLQEKLQSLSKMGGHLQIENKGQHSLELVLIQNSHVAHRKRALF